MFPSLAALRIIKRKQTHPVSNSILFQTLLKVLGPTSSGILSDTLLLLLPLYYVRYAIVWYDAHGLLEMVSYVPSWYDSIENVLARVRYVALIRVDFY